MQEIMVPIHTISEANKREHWRAGHARHKQQKYAVRLALLSHKLPQKLPVVVTMTRQSPRTLDSDNLQTAMKNVRDAIAEHFITDKAPGRADDDPRFEWSYHQIKSKERNTKLVFQWPDISHPLLPK